MVFPPLSTLMNRDDERGMIGPASALSNRAGDDSGKTSPGGAGRKESTMDFKCELLALLGLKPDAAEADVAAALANRKTQDGEAAALKNRAETAEAKVAAFEKQALETQVAADLEKYKDRVSKPDEVRAALLANREATLKVLEALKPPAASSAEPLRNRMDAKPPESADEEDLKNRSKQQTECVEEIRNRERNAGRPVSFGRAWDIARSEKPELFK
jgi:hypothetical protein